MKAFEEMWLSYQCTNQYKKKQCSEWYVVVKLVYPVQWGNIVTGAARTDQAGVDDRLPAVQPRQLPHSYLLLIEHALLSIPQSLHPPSACLDSTVLRNVRRPDSPSLSISLPLLALQADGHDWQSTVSLPSPTQMWSPTSVLIAYSFKCCYL